MYCGYCGNRQHERSECLKEAVVLYERKHARVINLLERMFKELNKQRLTEPPTDEALDLIEESKNET